MTDAASACPPGRPIFHSYAKACLALRPFDYQRPTTSIVNGRFRHERTFPEPELNDVSGRQVPRRIFAYQAPERSSDSHSGHRKRSWRRLKPNPLAPSGKSGTEGPSARSAHRNRSKYGRSDSTSIGTAACEIGCRSIWRPTANYGAATWCDADAPPCRRQADRTRDRDATVNRSAGSVRLASRRSGYRVEAGTDRCDRRRALPARPPSLGSGHQDTGMDCDRCLTIAPCCSLRLRRCRCR
jgi:hypothetical protein